LAAFLKLANLEIIHREVIQHIENLADLKRLNIHFLLSQKWRPAFELLGMLSDSFQDTVGCFDPPFVTIGTMNPARFNLFFII